MQTPIAQASHGVFEFKDLSHEDPYFDIITNLNRTGIVMGDEEGRLNGENALNRAELVVIVVRATRIEVLASDKNCFPDVQEQWFAAPICAMVRLKWIDGYPDGLFRPARAVTAGESAKITVNALSTFQFTDLQEALDFIESRNVTMATVKKDSPITRKEAFARLYLIDNMEIEQMDSEGNAFDPAKDTLMMVEDLPFYVDFNQTQYERHFGKDPIILFFHAEWCPLCRSSEEAILDQLEDLRGGVIIFKLDYDTETDLKKEYSVTTQDTFVVLSKDAETLLKTSAFREKDDMQKLIDTALEK